MDNEENKLPPEEPQDASTDISNTEPTVEDAPIPEQTAPSDALSRTPEELSEESEITETADATTNNVDSPSGKEPKKPSAFKQFIRRVNIYFLMFLLLVVIASAIAIVNYLNSKKTPVEPGIASQQLTEEALRQLANTDATVGNTSQTLTIQGNATIEGQTLLRSDLNVAGNLQTGGSIQGPSLTISGSSNLADTQINSLQVAADMAIQGSTTMRDISVSGASTFSGPMTASQISVTRLVLSGNASLEVPNHISFPGPTPNRSINSSVLGAGGTASINGSDTSGTVNINTGNNPSPGCFVQITFHQAFSNQPHVLISPVGVAAGQTNYYVNRDQSGFSICTASPAPANQAFAFDYLITN